MINKELLKSPWDLIDSMTMDNGELMEEFELDDILVDISLKLINYRLDNNLTQKKLAEKLEVSQAMVSKLESGDYNPTVEQLWKISKKLNWTFKLILENKKDSEQQTWDFPDFIEEYNPMNLKESVEKLGESA